MMKTTDRSDHAAANHRVIANDSDDPSRRSEPVPVPGDWRGPADDRWWAFGLAALPFALLAMVSTIAVSALQRIGNG